MEVILKSKNGVHVHLDANVDLPLYFQTSVIT